MQDSKNQLEDAPEISPAIRLHSSLHIPEWWRSEPEDPNRIDITHCDAAAAFSTLCVGPQPAGALFLFVHQNDLVRRYVSNDHLLTVKGER